MRMLLTLPAQDVAQQPFAAFSTAFVQVQRDLRQRTCEDWPTASNMMVPVEQGRFLAWLISTLGVRKAIELGTFTGYSALLLA